PWDSPLPRPDGAFSSALAAGPAEYGDERPASQQSGFGARSESANSRQGQEGQEGVQSEGSAGSARGTPVQGQTEEQQRIQYQQSQANPNAQLPARYHTGARQAQAQGQTQTQRNGPAHKLQAKITGLERIGKKELILRFDVQVRPPPRWPPNMNHPIENAIQTNIPDFRTTQFRDIRRTHAEFTKLAEHLVSNNPESLVPAVPPPLTAAGAGTEEDEFRIKASMQRWLNVVCSNEHLMHDGEMVLFVESDFGYSPLVRMKPPATGVRRKVLKQFAPPPDDTPELQESVADSIRDLLYRFVLEQFRGRINVAISWMNEEWYNDKIRQKAYDEEKARREADGDTTEMTLPAPKKHYDIWVVKMMEGFMPYLDSRDNKVLIRFLSETPELTQPLIEKVKTLANDPERVNLCVQAFQYVFPVCPLLRIAGLLLTFHQLPSALQATISKLLPGCFGEPLPDRYGVALT
ncbi:Vacuolar protein sorting-associated protein 17, partial [Ascosphaera atra]